MSKADPGVAGGEARVKDPNLPALHRVGDVIAPRAPQSLESVPLELAALNDLIVKLAYTAPRFTTDWVCTQLHLSAPLVRDILEKLCFEGQIEQLWQTSQ